MILFYSSLYFFYPNFFFFIFILQLQIKHAVTEAEIKKLKAKVRGECTAILFSMLNRPIAAHFMSLSLTGLLRVARGAERGQRVKKKTFNT